MEIASFGKDSLPRHADHDTAAKTFLLLNRAFTTNQSGLLKSVQSIKGHRSSITCPFLLSVELDAEIAVIISAIP